jgi:hypothetical protein
MARWARYFWTKSIKGVQDDDGGDRDRIDDVTDQARDHRGTEDHKDHEVRELAGEHPEGRPPPAPAQDVGAVLGQTAMRRSGSETLAGYPQGLEHRLGGR